MAKEVPIPKEVAIPEELQILNADLAKQVIVVGSKGYEMYPLPEGRLELIITDVTAVMQKINPPDGRCAKCERVIKDALTRKIFKCPDDGEDLLTMNQNPVDVIIKSSKIPEWVEMVTGIPRDEAGKEITLPQMKHFAGIFWKQNLSDEGLPKESLENFKNLLKMMERQKKAEPTSAETETASAKPSP